MVNFHMQSHILGYSTLSAVKFNGFFLKFKVKFNSKKVKFNTKKVKFNTC